MKKQKKKIHITYKTRKNITVPECMGSLAELYLAEIPSIRSCKNYSGDLNIYNPEVFKLVLPPFGRHY